MENIDYKVTSRVNKNAYLKLRGKLMMSGTSFTEWLEGKVEEEVGGFKPIKPLEVPEGVSHKEVKELVKEAAFKKGSSLCPHGAMKGLCRKGCK